MNKKYGFKTIARITIFYLTFFLCMSDEFLIKQSCNNKDKWHYKKTKNKNRLKLPLDVTYTLNKHNIIPVLYVNKLYHSFLKIKENIKDEDVATATNPKLKKKEKKILKKYKNFLDIIPSKINEYEIIDAIEKIKTLAVHKFVESIDLYLSFSSKKSKMTKNDNIKTFITLPHNLKKKRTKTVYVITNRDLQAAAVNAGGDVVGEDDLINKIKERQIRLQKKNTNFLLCSNDVIHKVTKIGKEIGRKGLMPNEKCGTLVSTMLLLKHIQLFKYQNTCIFKLNRLNTLNINVGDVYMTNDEIRENICFLFEYLDYLEFFHFNFKNLKSMYLSSTMGFSFKIKKNFL